MIPSIKNYTRREELYKYRLQRGDTELFKHQKIISRFLSGHNTYSELLLYHQQGLGKSCSAVAVAELLNNNNAIKKALVITNNDLLSRNFQKELVNKCTNKKYFPAGFEYVDDKYFIDNVQIRDEREESAEKKFWRKFGIRAKKVFKDNYGFNTYIKFAKEIKNMSDGELVRKFSNYLFILDEIHNIELGYKPAFGVDVYAQFKRLFDLLSSRKILMLSGTPMVDRPSEIADIMNLMLRGNGMPTGANFDREFLRKVDDLYYVKDNKKEVLGRYFKGRVSYLKITDGDVKITYNGSIVPPLRYFNVFKDEMSAYQGREYLRAVKLDESETEALYKNSRDASIMVSKDKCLAELKTSTDKMAVLRKYCIKYHNIIDIMNTRPTENVFIYSWRVSDVGILAFSEILNTLGYTKLRKNQTISTMQPGKRYIVITSDVDSTTTKGWQDQYNNPLNKNGEYIRLIIGSEAVAEGLSFHNVQQIHVASPGWNYSKVEQAIYRGIRLGSHKDLQNPTVNIYQHVSTLADTQRDRVLNRMSLGFDSDNEDTNINDAIDAAFDADSDSDGDLSDDAISNAIDDAFDADSDSDLDLSDNELDEEIDNILSDGELSDNAISNALDDAFDADTDTDTDTGNDEVVDVDEATASSSTIIDDADEIVPICEEECEEVIEISITNNSFREAQGSIELYMYKFSETKDFSIKQIDRIMLKYAFDCQLFKDRNYNPENTNNSRACQYQSCLYTCPGISNDFNLDISSYQLDYPEDYKIKVLDYIRNIYKTRSAGIISMAEIIENIDGINDFQLLNILKDSIFNNTIFYNRYGVKSYLRNFKNYIFLISNIRNQDSYMENYYNTVLLLNQFIDLAEYTNSIELKNTKELFQQIVNVTPTERRDLITQLKAIYQANIFEIAYKSTNNSEFRDWVINYYSPYTFTLTDGRIVHTILKSANAGDLKCFNNEFRTWGSCDNEDVPINTLPLAEGEDVEHNIGDEINDLIKQRFTNASEFYGLYNPYPDGPRARGEILDGNEFYIDNFKLREIKPNTNLNQTTGIVCKTSYKKNILPIVVSIDIYTQVELEDMTGTSNKNIQTIITDIQKVAEKEYLPWKFDQLGDLDRYTLLKLLYFGKLKKPGLCKLLYTWYKANNLLVVSIN